MYCVGRFPDEDNSVESFPVSWLIEPNKNTCYWPLENIKKSIKKAHQPDPDSWGICNVVIMGSYDTFKDANAAANTAQYTSDLEKSKKTPRKNRSDISDAAQPAGTINQPSAPTTSGIPSTIESATDDNIGEDGVIIDLADVGVSLSQLQFDELRQRISGIEVAVAAIGSSVEETKMKITEIAEVQSTLTVLVNGIVTGNQLTQLEPAQDIQSVVILPATNIEDLVKSNEFLKTAEGKRALTKFFIGTGGSDLSTAVQNAIQKVMSDDIAVQFSLKGAGGKKRILSYTGLIGGLREAVRSFPSLCQIVNSGLAVDSFFDSAVGATLKKISDRVRERKKKELAQQATPAN